MKELGERAGGEPPLPKRPDLTHLDDLISPGWATTSSRLSSTGKTSSPARSRIGRSEPKPSRCASLAGMLCSRFWSTRRIARRHQPRTESQAIRRHRGLLNDPDPVPGMVETLTHSLRSALNSAYARCQALQKEGLSVLSRLQHLEPVTGRRPGRANRSVSARPPPRYERRQQRRGSLHAGTNQAAALDRPVRRDPHQVFPSSGGGGKTTGARGAAGQAAGRYDQKRRRPENVARQDKRTHSHGSKKAQ